MTPLTMKAADHSAGGGPAVPCCGAGSVWTQPASGGPLAHVRLLGDAIVFACAGMENTTQRHALTLLCSTGPQPLCVKVEGQVVEGHMLCIQPMVLKTVCALNQPLVLVDLEPTHPHYRRFQAPHMHAVHALTPGDCTAFFAMARGFEAGELAGTDLDRSARHAVDALARTLPAPEPLDKRVAHLMTMLDVNLGAELDALAEQQGLSAHHASRLFSHGLGLPLRRYALSVKMRAAASFMGSGCPLTEVAQAAGFVDSAHFAKVWTQSFGASPSQFFCSAQTRIDTLDQPDWLMWYLARRDADAPPLPRGTPKPWLHRRKSRRV